VNDFQLAALGFAASAVVFIIAAVRSGDQHQREHQVWLAIGAALLAAMFAVVFYDLGNIVDRLQEGLAQFGSDLNDLPQP
jgi:hypothetical protein